MADPGGHPCTYTLHGNVVAGVSWRPTHFTEALPWMYVCSLCGVVPERTLVSPCMHAFCEVCLVGNTGGASLDNVWQCPFDGCVCNVEVCLQFQLPPLTAGDFKAYCWNEARGCTFVGDLPSMLHHFDHDCSFHAVLCPRCGVQVPRVDLTIHQRHECSSTSASPDTTSGDADGQSMRYRALTLDDVTAAFEELKVALTSPGQEQLATIRGQLNDLQERVKIQFGLLGEFAWALLRAERSLNDSLERIISTLVPMDPGGFLAQLRPTTSGQAEDPNGENYSADGRPMPCNVENMHNLRTLEVASGDLLRCVRDVSDAMASFQRHPERAYDESDGCHVSDVFRSLPQLETDEIRDTRYKLRATVTGDVFKSFPVYPVVLGIVTLCPTRFIYCTVLLGTSKWEDKLDVYFKWASISESPAAMPNNCSVTLVHPQDPRQNRVMEMDYRNNGYPMGCQLRFWTTLSDIEKSGLVHDNTLTFQVLIEYESR
ncbi:hypothetical protein HPB48_017116 [Haemaphysalis longicornis]|uniref:Uncharacterized protein n=1 Tax=Haemaphysalis longicornis TaxID=44386 RepID=A0A9J6FLH4_HAELO|nr:hypothetical protein HPB48_017116 [Haemaphysalis longicornis]